MVCTITAWSARALFYSQFCCKLQQNWTRLFAYSLGNPKSPMYLSSSEGKSVSVISTEERLNKGNSFISRKIVNKFDWIWGKSWLLDLVSHAQLYSLTHGVQVICHQHRKRILWGVLLPIDIIKTCNKAEHTFHCERKFELSSCG